VKRKQSFFEKKDQKTFAPRIKVLCFFLSRKETLLSFALACVAADAPPSVKPMRDVDVTYKVPVGEAGRTAMLQRLRYSAALHRQRLDLPTSGNWMMLDFVSHRMEMVRDESHEVVDLPAPDSASLPGNGAGFVRVGPAVVAGLACTEWRTRDSRGHESIACYTEDGVMLRARQDGRTLMEAISVHYGVLADTVFTVPDGYTRQVR
jgi:hypothetical protein